MPTYKRICDLCYQEFEAKSKRATRCPDCFERVQKARSYICKLGISTKGMSAQRILAIAKEKKLLHEKQCAWCGKTTTNKFLCKECNKLGRRARLWCRNNGFNVYTHLQALTICKKHNVNLEELEEYKPKPPKSNSRRCRKCGRKLKYNRFICSKCLRETSSRIDGDWIYA